MDTEKRTGASYRGRYSLSGDCRSTPGQVINDVFLTLSGTDHQVRELNRLVGEMDRRVDALMTATASGGMNMKDKIPETIIDGLLGATRWDMSSRPCSSKTEQQKKTTCVDTMGRSALMVRASQLFTTSVEYRSLEDAGDECEVELLRQNLNNMIYVCKDLLAGVNMRDRKIEELQNIRKQDAALALRYQQMIKLYAGKCQLMELELYRERSPLEMDSNAAKEMSKLDIKTAKKLSKKESKEAKELSKKESKAAKELSKIAKEMSKLDIKTAKKLSKKESKAAKEMSKVDSKACKEISNVDASEVEGLSKGTKADAVFLKNSTSVEELPPADIKPATDLSKADITPVTELSQADIKPNTALSPADITPATELHQSDIKPNTALSPADIKPDTELSPADIKPATELSPADIKPDTELSPADIKPNTALSPADIKPDTELSPADIKPATELSPADIKPATELSQADITPSTKLTKADIKPATKLTKADIKPATELSQADIKPATKLTKADIKPATKLTKADIKPATKLTKADIKPDTELSQADIKPATELSQADITPSTELPQANSKPVKGVLPKFCKLVRKVFASKRGQNPTEGHSAELDTSDSDNKGKAPRKGVEGMQSSPIARSRPDETREEFTSDLVREIVGSTRPGQFSRKAYTALWVHVHEHKGL